MAAKSKNATKRKIVAAAWKLFYEQGYDDTVDDIIRASGTSKGSFYHYFEGKDALLSTLSLLFDEKYEELLAGIDPEMDRFDMLLWLNAELFAMIENTVLVTRGDKHLLDRNRVYYKALRRIAAEGQERGELRSDLPVNEITKLYAVCERALLYDWCICEGDYSLKNYAKEVMPRLLGHLRGENKK